MTTTKFKSVFFTIRFIILFLIFSTQCIAQHGDEATEQQLNQAHIITESIKDLSNVRRDSLNNISPELLELPEEYRRDDLAGPGEVERYSTQTYYLNTRGELYDWWYISSGNVVAYFDDLITIQFNTNASEVQILFFKDKKVTNSLVIAVVGEKSPLSAGSIITGDQSIWNSDEAANINATSAYGGECPNYIYQWQFSNESSENYVNIQNANMQTLIVRPIIERLQTENPNDNAYFFRRMVVCGTDTLLTGSIAIYMNKALSPGSITTPQQSIPINEVPLVIHATNATYGVCSNRYEYQWQLSYDNNSFQDIVGAFSDSLLLDNSIDQKTYYRRKVTCGESIAYTTSTFVSVFIPSLKPGGEISSIVSSRKLPSPYLISSQNYVRTFVPVIPIQDTSLVNNQSLVENVLTSTMFADSYGRTIQIVGKQGSPNKVDYVSPVVYDKFGRPSIEYLPFVANDGNVSDGNFKMNPFTQDSIFYKSLFPNENINYRQVVYDGSPMNIPVFTMSEGNSWGGANHGITYTYRTNNLEDSVRYWTIGINNEDDVPQTLSYYVPGSLSVQEVVDENGIIIFKFIDELGRTVLSKTLLRNKVKYGSVAWLCTYYIYDEMNHLRVVIPPKAIHALSTPAINWNLTGNNGIFQKLCYTYFYDQFGRNTIKSIPDKGKSFTAFDKENRVVMTQDPNLRTYNKWAFVKYDGQSRPYKSGIILSPQTRDEIFSSAANSNNYPSLDGANYIVTSENYYDDYSWIASNNIAIPSALDQSVINSTNFNTNYLTSPEYATPLTSSKHIRGSLTGTRQLILNTSQYLNTVSFYDGSGRVIQTIQTNYSGGKDITTVQYAFSGKLLRSHLKHEKSGTNPQTHTVLSKYEYDHAGRLLTLKKNFDDLVEKTISQYIYNELGQVVNKAIGNQLETQQYNYNIRGWLLGINAGYVNSPGATVPGEVGSHFFGERISYDQGFTNKQYNGNIAGIQWKAGGDRIARAYGFVYDYANRLIHADFNQQNQGSSDWTKDKVDYSVSNLSYDGNGNILTMTQRGLKLGSSSIIDSLAYQYFANSNVLQKVTDLSGSASPLGDFQDSVSTADDYTYDINGNIIRDINRKMFGTGSNPGAVFNLLDKPDSIVIAGKSGTHYYYNASGVTLAKKVNEYSSTGTITKNYLYINGFVYLNDTLQYALNEEGCVRLAKKVNSQTGENYTAFEYDYFLKDHQGNIRTVITEGKDTAMYQATMEPARQAVEDALFSNAYTPVNTQHPKPGGFDNDSQNQKVARLNGASGSSSKTGPSLVLKVMAGDKVQINTYAWYNTIAQQPQNGVNLLTELLAIIPGAVMGVGGGKLAMGNNSLLSAAISPNLSQFLNNNRPYDNSKPRAYLNWILFDEQFNYVSSNSGVKQVMAGTEKQPLVAPLQTIGKNGFLYVYVSNESPQDVYFDDLTVKHFTGPLQQEQSFYPFGLQMAAISSKALLKTNVPFKYNAGNELEAEGSLNYYNTFYRKYDAQLGRFTGVDIRAEESYGMSVYNYGANNPVLYNDPMGDMFGRSLKGTDGNYHVSWVSQMQWNDKGFYDWGLGNSEGGGGGGSGISNLRDIRGLFVSTILANTQFGELPKQNKNGEFGFWKKYTFDPGIPGDGKVNLAGVGIGQMWIPFQSYQQNIEDIAINSPTDICKASFSFTRIFSAKVGELDGSWQVAAVSGIRMNIVDTKTGEVLPLRLKTIYFGLPVLRKGGQFYSSNYAQSIAARCVTNAEKNVMDLYHKNPIVSGLNIIGLTGYFREQINAQMQKFGGSATLSSPMGIDTSIPLNVNEASYSGIFGFGCP
jgi:RHS repeat-associated protein